MTDSQTITKPTDRTAVGGRGQAFVMRQRIREYLEATKPMNDVKVAIYSRTVPDTIIHPNGEFEHRYNFTPEQQETLRLADEAIEAVKARIFGA